MNIVPLTFENPLWNTDADYAERCPWRAGKDLANRMRSGAFNGWERVFVAISKEQIAGFCAFVEWDCIPDVSYTPYISYVFVDKDFRGHRLSESMIRQAGNYAHALGFQRLYLVSDHVNLYEKYGFIKIDAKPAPWNAEVLESIFSLTLPSH